MSSAVADVSAVDRAVEGHARTALVSELELELEAEALDHDRREDDDGVMMFSDV